MKYDLTEFDRLVDEGYIRRVETDKLVLYNYTDKCTYEKHWNEYTLAARGIIFEKKSGRLVAKPFPKFFNLGEMPNTMLTALPDEPYTVTEKVDGSLGIVYYYDNQWNVATRGSFSSPQALKGQEILNRYYNIAELWAGITYLVEIIYPENKIVVDYKGEEKLVLLGSYFVSTETEAGVYASLEGIPAVKSYAYTIEEMIELQNTLPKDREGFVVRFNSGLRIKIKGKEYFRIHKIISELSPLSAWEVMQDGKVPKTYLEQVPEEYLKDFQPIVDELERQYRQICIEIQVDCLKLPHCGQLGRPISDKEYYKAVGLFLAAPNELRHSGAIFPTILNHTEALNKYIMKAIRPTSNMLRSIA